MPDLTPLTKRAEDMIARRRGRYCCGDDVACACDADAELVERLLKERNDALAAVLLDSLHLSKAVNISVNAALIINAVYEWLERVEKAGGATSISGVAACNAMLKSLRKEKPRVDRLIRDPVQELIKELEAK